LRRRCCSRPAVPSRGAAVTVMATHRATTATRPRATTATATTPLGASTEREFLDGADGVTAGGRGADGAAGRRAYSLRARLQLQAASLADIAVLTGINRRRLD